MLCLFIGIYIWYFMFMLCYTQMFFLASSLNGWNIPHILNLATLYHNRHLTKNVINFIKTQYGKQMNLKELANAGIYIKI